MERECIVYRTRRIVLPMLVRCRHSRGIPRLVWPSEHVSVTHVWVRAVPSVEPQAGVKHSQGSK